MPEIKIVNNKTLKIIFIIKTKQDDSLTDILFEINHFIININSLQFGYWYNLYCICD